MKLVLRACSVGTWEPHSKIGKKGVNLHALRKFYEFRRFRRLVNRRKIQECVLKGKDH